MSRPRGVLATLSLTEITSWGVLFYAFPVLAPSITDDTGWSSSSVTAAFSAGLVVSALAGIPVGRVLDRSGPRGVMTAGSALGGLSVLGIALAPTLPLFAAAWVLAGFAMAAVFYPPAFAALTRWYDGAGRVRALTVLTLAAGLASTVFAPLTAALAERLDWRGVYLVLGAILVAVTVPLHAFGLKGRWPAAPERADGEGAGPVRQVATSAPFVLLAVAFMLASFTLYAVLMHQVPLFTSRGASLTLGAAALGLGGVGQVLGRLAYGGLTRRTGVRVRTVAILLATGATTAVLGLLPGPLPVLVAVAMLAGAVRGIFTLLQATAVTERWGTEHYASLTALLSAPLMAALALAPWGSTALLSVLGSYPALFAVLAALSFAAAVLAVWSTPRRW